MEFPKRRDMIRALLSSRDAKLSDDERNQFAGWSPYSLDALRLLTRQRLRWDALDERRKAWEIRALQRREGGEALPASGEMFFGERVAPQQPVAAERTDSRKSYALSYYAGIRHVPKAPERTVVSISGTLGEGRVIRFMVLPNPTLARRTAERAPWTAWYPRFGADLLADDDAAASVAPAKKRLRKR